MTEAHRLEVVYKPTASLSPYGHNSRTHTDEQIDQLVASMEEWDWTNPILVTPDDRIIAGHARHLAAKRRGLEEVPTIELGHLTEAQIRAYIIADNKLAENAGWDMDLLSAEVQALYDEGYRIAAMGFDEQEIVRLLAMNNEEGLTDPDDCPEPEPDAVVSVVGDVWVLGGHRLVNGDCTSEAVVASAIGSVVPNLMVTDPPYGVNYTPEWRKTSGLGDGVAKGLVMNDDRADWREAWALFPGNVAYVWHAGTKAHIVADSLVASGFQIRSQIVWVKNRFVISRGHYHSQHEPVFDAVRVAGGPAPEPAPELATKSRLDARADKPREGDDHENDYGHEVAQYAVRSGASGNWEGDRKQSTVWFIDHTKNATGHGTQKPVECMERPIRNNSSPGQAVYEPFCGSGTTIIACQKTGRACYAIELDPVYCDMIIRRWQDYTGSEAVLEATGQSFADVKADRVPPVQPGSDPINGSADPAADRADNGVGSASAGGLLE